MSEEYRIHYCKNCGNIYNITDNISEYNGNVKEIGGEKKDYFICDNCATFEEIEPNTKLIIKQPKNKTHQTYNLYENPEFKIHNSTLLKTRNYICPNKDCLTHKQPELRCANIEHTSYNSVIVKYMCEVCKTEWTNN